MNPVVVSELALFTFQLNWGQGFSLDRSDFHRRARKARLAHADLQYLVH